jgi:hypothetical protein
VSPPVRAPETARLPVTQLSAPFTHCDGRVVGLEAVTDG